MATLQAWSHCDGSIHVSLLQTQLWPCIYTNTQSQAEHQISFNKAAEDKTQRGNVCGVFMRTNSATFYSNWVVVSSGKYIYSLVKSCPMFANSQQASVDVSIVCLEWNNGEEKQLCTNNICTMYLSMYVCIYVSIYIHIYKKGIYLYFHIKV